MPSAASAEATLVTTGLSMSPPYCGCGWQTTAAARGAPEGTASTASSRRGLAPTAIVRSVVVRRANQAVRAATCIMKAMSPSIRRRPVIKAS